MSVAATPFRAVAADDTPAEDGCVLDTFSQDQPSARIGHQRRRKIAVDPFLRLEGELIQVIRRLKHCTLLQVEGTRERRMTVPVR